jgi:hypothetical protein
MGSFVRDDGLEGIFFGELERALALVLDGITLS